MAMYRCGGGVVWRESEYTVHSTFRQKNRPTRQGTSASCPSLDRWVMAVPTSAGQAARARQRHKPWLLGACLGPRPSIVIHPQPPGKGGGGLVWKSA